MTDVRFDVPDNFTPATCRSCGAPIVWIETKAGKHMPLSLATKDENGKAVSHFADCVNADKHRKAK